MTNITPGPWRYGLNKRGQRRVFAADGWEVVRAMSARRNKQERDANARLIAAAPDLLAALQEIVLHCRPDGLPEPIAAAKRYPRELARAAIARATEGQS